MTLRLACSDFAFPLLEHSRVLDLIAALEIPGVDIGIFGGRSHLGPERIVSDIPKAATELRLKMQERGLQVADIFLIPGGFDTLAPNHPDAAERGRSRDLFQRILEFTVRCNATHMTCLPGIPWKQETLDSSLKRSSEELAWRMEQAKQVGVVFAVEPHLGSIAPSPETVIQLLEMTPGLSLTLDYTHFTYQGIKDNAVEPLVAFASHFHARCGAKSRPQVAFEKNEIDYARVIDAMKEYNYSGYVELEYVWIDWEHCNEVDNLSETIRLRDFLLQRIKQKGDNGV